MTRIAFSYGETSGPRTEVSFTVDAVYEGSVPSNQLVLSVFGGFLPSGRFATTSHAPAFAEGQRRLLLLRSDSAFWSPIVTDYDFTVEEVDGEEVVLGPDGRLLLSIGVLGPRFGSETLFDGPHLEGEGFTYPKRLPTVPSDRGISVAAAVSAIRAVIDESNVVIGGPLGSIVPDWSPWNSPPVAGVEP